MFIMVYGMKETNSRYSQCYSFFLLRFQTGMCIIKTHNINAAELTPYPQRIQLPTNWQMNLWVRNCRVSIHVGTSKDDTFTYNA